MRKRQILQRGEKKKEIDSKQKQKNNEIFRAASAAAVKTALPKWVNRRATVVRASLTSFRTAHSWFGGDRSCKIHIYDIYIYIHHIHISTRITVHKIQKIAYNGGIPCAKFRGAEIAARELFGTFVFFFVGAIARVSEEANIESRQTANSIILVEIFSPQKEEEARFVFSFCFLFPIRRSFLLKQRKAWKMASTTMTAGTTNVQSTVNGNASTVGSSQQSSINCNDELDSAEAINDWNVSNAVANQTVGTGNSGDALEEMTTGNGKNNYKDCAICFSKLSSPRVLACLHVFCETCIDNLLIDEAGDSKIASILTCPVCRQNTHVGPKGPASLACDYVLTNILDMSAIENMAVLCTSCKAKENAVARCSDCANFLCPNCNTAHQFMRCFESHKVIAFEDLKRSDQAIPIHKPIFCDYHPAENMKFYCYTCQVRYSFINSKSSHAIFTYILTTKLVGLFKIPLTTYQAKNPTIILSLFHYSHLNSNFVGIESLYSPNRIFNDFTFDFLQL